MIYLSNFFARGVEAVSVQIESARIGHKDAIISCGYLLGQKCLSWNDIRDNIWIFPKWLFPIASALILIFSNQPIHYFEDEPSLLRKLVLNFHNRPVYISLFKDITPELVQHLKSLKFLKGVTVELTALEQKLKQELIGIPVVRILPQPLWDKTVEISTQTTFIFASWNGGDKKTLNERGILNVLKLCKNTGLSCVIILRDNHIKKLKEYIYELGLSSQIRLVNPLDKNQLMSEFMRAQYVIMLPNKPIMKDVPNSIIDGFALGKPCVISSCLNFAEEVSNNHLGIVWDVNQLLSTIELPSEDIYNQMSEAAVNWIEQNVQSYQHVMKQLHEVN